MIILKIKCQTLQGRALTETAYIQKGSAHCEVDGLSLFLSGYNSAEEMII